MPGFKAARFPVVNVAPPGGPRPSYLRRSSSIQRTASRMRRVALGRPSFSLMCMQWVWTVLRLMWS